MTLKIFSLNSYKIGANTIEITSQELVKLYLGASKMIPHLKGPALLILEKIIQICSSLYNNLDKNYKNLGRL